MRELNHEEKREYARFVKRLRDKEDRAVQKRLAGEINGNMLKRVKNFCLREQARYAREQGISYCFGRLYKGNQ